MEGSRLRAGLVLHGHSGRQCAGLRNRRIGGSDGLGLGALPSSGCWTVSNRGLTGRLVSPSLPLVMAYQARAFDALGDGTRREIFERLAVRPARDAGSVSLNPATAPRRNAKESWYLAPALNNV